MDPFDGTGQFCDKGSSYYPAIFYATEEERLVAEGVLDTILLQQDWDEADIAAPILPRPVFWTAEDYHQDYYIKNPSNYGFYKNGCRRPQRLKEVWGEEEYMCYHEESHTCFVTADTFDDFGDDGNNATSSSLPTENAAADNGQLQITNEDGELVPAKSNIKGAGEEKAGLLPTWATITILVVITIIVLVCVTQMGLKLSERHKQQRRESEIAIEAEATKQATIIKVPSPEPKKEEDGV